MTISQLVLVVLLVGWSVFAAVGLCFIAPRAQRSRFRYRLWQIRDELYDSIAADTVPAKEGRCLLETIERHIAYHEDATLLNLLIATKLFPELKNAPAFEPWADPVLHDFQSRVDIVLINNFLRGSVLGFVYSVMLSLRSLRGALRHAATSRLEEVWRVIKNEVITSDPVEGWAQVEWNIVRSTPVQANAKPLPQEI